MDEAALRTAIDELVPNAGKDVLEAMVREYGIDPTWLLTGEYSAATHRRAVEAEGNELAQLFTEIARRESPAAGAPKFVDPEAESEAGLTL